MPGQRSAYSVEWDALSSVQRRRTCRDSWYRTSHSRPHKEFIEIDADVAVSVKRMAVAKSLNARREEECGHHSNQARVASLSAFKIGKIDRAQLKEDHRIISHANKAKHTQFFQQPCRLWADLTLDPLSLDDPWAKSFDCRTAAPPASGPVLDADKDPRMVERSKGYIEELEMKIATLESWCKARMTRLRWSLVSWMCGELGLPMGPALRTALLPPRVVMQIRPEK